MTCMDIKGKLIANIWIDNDALFRIAIFEWHTKLPLYIIHVVKNFRESTKSANSHNRRV